MTKKQKNARAKKISRAIDLVCGSLTSHTEWCWKKEIKGNGKHAFHVRCTKEYVEILEILTGLY